MDYTVLFIIDTLETGGAEKSLLEITSRFKKYSPLFIQLFQGDSLYKRFKDSGIEVIQLNLQPSYRFKEIAEKVLKVIDEQDVLLIHSTLFRSDQVSRIVARKLGVPLINSLVNNSYGTVRYASLSITQRLKLKFVEWIDRRSASNVDLFISNSHEIKGTNIRALKIKEAKVKTIFRGRQIDSFEGTHDTSDLQRDFDLRGQKVFLNVSRLLERKGQLDIIEAFSQLPVESNVILIIAGEGIYRSILEQRIDELGLNKKVLLLGNRNDVPQLLQLADFFVFASHYEGLPGALIEAMMSRTPIIASDIPENLECVSVESALIFKKGNIGELNQAMSMALNCNNWSKKVELAYNDARSNFDIYQVASQYELAYNQLLND